MRSFIAILVAVIAINVYLNMSDSTLWTQWEKPKSCKRCIAAAPSPQELPKQFRPEKVPEVKAKPQMALAQEITVAMDAIPELIHPHSVKNAAQRSLLLALFDGLTRRNLAGEVEPSVAKDIEFSDDHDTVVIQLRESQWSNGNAVTAQDFVYAWKKLLLSKAPAAEALLIIKNARAVRAGELPEEELGVYIASDEIFVIALEEPTPHFLELLAEPAFYPISMVHEQSGGAELLGNGPFKVASRSAEALVLEKNPRYWDKGDLHLEKIQFTVTDSALAEAYFLGGELHWLGAPFSQGSKTLDQELRPKHRTELLVLDTESFPLNNRKFRQALAQALDRQALAPINSNPALRLLPPGLAMGSRVYLEEKSNNESQQLLQEAIDELGISRDTLPTLTLGEGLRSKELQAQWSQTLGIETEIVRGKAQIHEASFSTESTHPLAMLKKLRWGHFHYDELLNKKRLAEAERVAMEEMPVIPLLHPQVQFARSPLLRDSVITPGGCCDFKWARLKRL